MPKIKIVRDDIIRLPEWLETLQKAASLDFTRAWQIPPYQLWLVAVLALDWMFGKRIHEILKLKREDVWFEDERLFVRFHVGKKRGRKDTLAWMPYTKWVTVKHRAYPYFKQYLEEFDRDNPEGEGYLFPANTEPQKLGITTAYVDGEGQKQKGHYEYMRSGGYVRSNTASHWLRKVNPKIYFHLGRHTKGGSIAEKGGTEIEIARVLDCTTRTASRYTVHSPTLADRWQEQTA